MESEALEKRRRIINKNNKKGFAFKVTFDQKNSSSGKISEKLIEFTVSLCFLFFSNTHCTFQISIKVDEKRNLKQVSAERRGK